MTMNVDEVKKLKVAELKVELQKRELATSGNKAELQARLEDYLRDHPQLTYEDPDADLAPPGSLNVSSRIPKTQKIETNIQERPPVKSSVSSSHHLVPKPSSTVPKSTTVAKLSSAEKLPTHEERLKARAIRFQQNGSPNMSHEDGGDSGSDVAINLDALKRRQERFGEVTRETEELLKRSEQEEKCRKRAERFGIVPEEILRKRRLERFGMQ